MTYKKDDGTGAKDLSNSNQTLRSGVNNSLKISGESNIKCDPLSENPALRANIEFEIEAILSVQVVSRLN